MMDPGQSGQVMFHYQKNYKYVTIISQTNY
jgi:hypothetical protein